jgi:WD40 repeat protein
MVKSLVFTLVIVFIILVLAGCITSTPVAMNENPVSTSTATTIHIPSINDTRTPTLTPTPNPTLTPTLTITATIPPTPTLALPVDLAQIFPKPSQPISREHIKEIREIATSGSPRVFEVRISSNGKTAYVITAAGIKVYDVVSKKLIQTFPVTMCTQNFMTCFSTNAVTISSDGDKFAILTNDAVQLWDLSGALLLELPLFEMITSYSIGLSPDGNYFAVTGPFGPNEPYNQVSIYNVKNAEKIRVSPEMIGRYLKFSPNGTWLAVWDDLGGGTLWQTDSWTKQTNLFFTSNETTLEFSPDDQLIVMTGNNNTSIYQVDPWKLRREFAVQNDQWARTYKNFFSPSSKKFAVMHSAYNRQKMDSEYKIWVWDLNTGELQSETEIEKMNPYYTVSDDGSIGIRDDTAELWPIIRASSKIVRTIPCMGNCSRMFFSPEGDRFELWHFNWEVRKNKKTSEFCTIRPGLDISCNTSSDSIFLNVDGHYYTIRDTDTDQRYGVYDDEGTLLGAFICDVSVFMQEHLWLSQDKGLLLLNVITPDFRQVIELWNIRTETIVKQWSGYAFRQDAYSNENQIAILFDMEGKLVVYDYEEGKEILTQALNSYERGAISFTQDGSLIFTSRIADSKLRIDSSLVLIEKIHPKTKEKSTIARVQVLGSSIDALAQSPDGLLLAVGTPDGYIRIIALENGEEIHNWQAHSRNITQLNFSPDGTFLVSYSLGSENGGDGLLKIWGIWP